MPEAATGVGMSERRDPVLAVVGVTLLAFAVRFVALDARPFHWSEGRVGYWALRFAETGAYEYRPVAGGPFVYVAARWAIELFGASDAVARAPVALLTALGPLAALLFRGPLDDRETVALAGVLAFQPVVVYYSRFLRGDALAAVFGLVVLGGAVRYRRRDDWWGLSLAGGALAAAVAASGFAVAYLLVAPLAALFVLDEARVRGVPERARRTLFGDHDHPPAHERLAAHATPVARAVFVFLAVWYVLFAPRAPGLAPGLYDPTRIFTVAGAAFEGTVRSFWEYRVVYRLQPRTPGRHGLIEYALPLVETAIRVAPVTLAAGLVGFFTERYRSDTRPLVAFGGYATLWGVFVLAVAAPEPHPWVAVHLVAFAALPAAVGLARLASGLRRRARVDEPARVALALSVVVAAVAVAGPTLAAPYAPPERGSPFTQYAQPTDDPGELVPAVQRATANNTGVDVLYVAPRFDTRQEYDTPPIAEVDRERWGNRLPLQWYLERGGVETQSAFNLSYLPLGAERVPVVVTTPRYADGVAGRLDGEYTRHRLQLGVHSRNVTVFVQG